MDLIGARSDVSVDSWPQVVVVSTTRTVRIRSDGIEVSSILKAQPPRGSAPPPSMWDGIRRFRTSAFEKVVNEYWGTWSLPSRVCFGDSGAPTFVDDPRETRATRRLVAVVSDGGIDGANKDARVRVDTAAMHEWIARVIREELGHRARLEQ